MEPYNIRNNIDIDGLFGTNENNIKIPGHLKIKDGLITVNLFGFLDIETLDIVVNNKNSNDYTLYGVLDNGIYFIGDRFIPSISKMHFGSDGLFNLTLTIFEACFEEKVSNINHPYSINFSFDKINDWETIIPYDKVNLLPKFKVNFNTHDIEVSFINCISNVNSNKEKSEKFNRVINIISSDIANSERETLDLSRNLCSLLGLLIFSPIQMKCINITLPTCSKKILETTSIKNNQNFNYFTEPLSLYNLKSNIANIFKTFFEKEEKLKSLLNPLILELNNSLPSFSSLINFTNGIEVYFHDIESKSNLTHQLQHLLSFIPIDIRNNILGVSNKDNKKSNELSNLTKYDRNTKSKYLSENDNNFITNINIFRNHFVHGNDLSKSYTDIDITIYSKQLNLFVYSFILLEIKIPKKLILEKIKLLIPVNDKNRYI